MKTLQFNANSWHCKMALAGGFCYELDDHNNNVGDICAYTSAIFKACLAAIFLLGAFAFVAFLLIEVIFGLAFSWWAGAWLMSSYGEVTLILLGMGSCVMLGAFMTYRIREWRKNQRNAAQNQPDSFVKHAYMSWREKYCAKIIFR